MRTTGDQIRVLHVADPASVDGSVATVGEDSERFVVESAADTDGALAKLAEDVDCVVAGYDLPDGTGVDLLKAVREEHPTLPFILYTDAGSEAVASDAVSAGVTDYLPREHSERSGTLADRIERAVEEHRSQQGVDEERQLELFFEQSPLGVIQWNEAFELVRMNRAAERILGYAEEALIGESWETVVPESERDAIDEVTDSLLENRGGYHSVNENVREDGERIVCEWHNRVVTDGDEVVAVFSQFHDVTERRAQRRDLKRTNTVLQTVLQNLPAGVLVESANREVLVANDRLCSVLGLQGAGADLAGEDCETLVEEIATQFDDSEAFTARVEEILSAREPVRGETLTTADGRTLERDYVPYTLPDGEAGLWIYRDVTERTARERELEAQNARLDEFASVVSHDLRNPLNVAQGRVELAREECDTDHLEPAANAIDRSLTLIEDLLTLSREGGQITEFETLALGPTTESCWQNVETEDATLLTETERTVRANPSRLKELLENLIRNAVEHGSTDRRSETADTEHNDGVRVTVGDTQDGFFVADDGDGIPREERERVFEAGYSSSEDGTGFGLNIVREIADAHGWNVRVTESETGGARFEFRDVTVVDD